jgi:hypothetical protein
LCLAFILAIYFTVSLLAIEWNVSTWNWTYISKSSSNFHINDNVHLEALTGNNGRVYSYGNTSKSQKGERCGSCCQLATCCCITFKMAELTCRKLQMFWDMHCYQECFVKVYGPTVSVCSCVPVFLHNLWIPSVSLTKFF